MQHIKSNLFVDEWNRHGQVDGYTKKNGNQAQEERYDVRKVRFPSLVCLNIQSQRRVSRLSTQVANKVKESMLDADADAGCF
jgi:hypothetical protein